MDYKFYHSMSGRFLYSILATGIGLAFIVALLVMKKRGINYSYDGLQGAEIIIILFLSLGSALLGIATFHFLRLVFSPWPSLTINEKGIYYRSDGVAGAVEVEWPDVLIVKQEGLFKEFYLTVWLKNTAQMNLNRNRVYKLARWLFPRLSGFAYLLRFRAKTAKKAKYFTVSRFSVDVPLGEIKKLIEEKTQRAFQYTASQIAIENASKNSVVERNQGMRPERIFGAFSSTIMMWVIIAMPLAGFALGIVEYSKNVRFSPVVQATEQLRELAVSGDADAQNKLGWRYSNGVGVPKSERKATKWYRMAAIQGFAKAQYNLALAYHKGNGAKRDYKRAAKWYRKAADQELLQAQTGLGYLYLKGKGVKRSYVRARSLFSLAAEQDHKHAFYYLGWMHEKGKSFEPSRDKTIAYYEKAARKNSKLAQKALRRLSVKAGS